jgi:hypothetical protein
MLCSLTVERVEERMVVCGSNSVGRVAASQAESRGFESRFPLVGYSVCMPRSFFADVAQMVEHFLGKEEVGSSILLISSQVITKKAQARTVCAASYLAVICIETDIFFAALVVFARDRGTLFRALKQHKVFPRFAHGRSSTGRVTVSKTAGCGFDSYRPCKGFIHN